MFFKFVPVVFFFFISVKAQDGCEYYCLCDNGFVYCNELPFLPRFESASIIEEFTFVNSKFKVFSINRSEYPLLQKISFINCIINCKDLDQVRAIEGVNVIIDTECFINEVTTPASSVLTSTMLTGTAQLR